ncbi:hypothetical protein [Saccharopolyspora taberi]
MTDGAGHDLDKRIPGVQLRLTGDIFAAPESGWFGTDTGPGTANGGRNGSGARRRQRTVNTFFGADRSSTRGQRREGA